MEALASLNPAAGPRGYEVHDEELGHDGNPSSTSSGGAGAGGGSSGGSSGGRLAAALEAAHLAAAPAVLRAAAPVVHHPAVHPEKKRVMANTPMQGPGTALNSTVMATTGTLEIRKKTTKLAIDHRAILHRQGSDAAASGLKERRAPNKGEGGTRAEDRVVFPPSATSFRAN